MARSSRRGSPRAACSPERGIKTAEQRAIFGGIVGQQYDQCYHLGCDDVSNLSTAALEQMADGAAHATITLGQSTEAINGVRGRSKFDVAAFKKPRPKSPNRL